MMPIVIAKWARAILTCPLCPRSPSRTSKHGRRAPAFRHDSRYCGRTTSEAGAGERDLPPAPVGQRNAVDQSVDLALQPDGQPGRLDQHQPRQVLKSSNPEVEEEVLTDIASYGKQLGRIEDMLTVLLDHFRPQRELAP